MSHVIVNSLEIRRSESHFELNASYLTHFKQVNFHEDGRGAPVSHVVQVPKSGDVAAFKSTVKDALADEDVVGEEIRATRLKWTYVEKDG
jgi:hypothetical protein